MAKFSHRKCSIISECSGGHVIRKFLPIAVLLACFFVVRSAVAQTGLTCSSEDGRRHYCNADTRGGVRLARQRSGSICKQGYSWGYDGRGVWVDRGCRADFLIGRPTGRGPGARNREPRNDNRRRQNNIITCSSDDGGRHNCNVDTRNGVRLTRQISGSPCRRGYSWGTGRGGIWVDHGCRAEFQIGR
jgi:DUF3011 family protein